MKSDLNIKELINNKKLILVGGKGGVGKTTVSAAISSYAAENNINVLLVSTDPAHSLSDAFDQEIGNKPRKLAPNLTVLEIDPDQEVDKYLDRVLAQMRRYAGPDQIAELQRHLRLSRHSPGAQEAALLEKLAQLMQDGLNDYDLLVFDTAPTGHTLRLLSLPEVMAAWTDGLLNHNKRSQELGSVLSHLTPSRSVDNIAGDPNEHNLEGLDNKSQELAQTLLKRQRLFHKTRHLLADSSKTAFLFVLTPEKLPILETQRAVQSLIDSDIYVAGAVVNRVLPENAGNDFWASRYQRQEKHLEELNTRLSHINKVMIPLQQDDVIGLDALCNFGKELMHIKN